MPVLHANRTPKAEHHQEKATKMGPSTRIHTGPVTKNYLDPRPEISVACLSMCRSNTALTVFSVPLNKKKKKKKRACFSRCTAFDDDGLFSTWRISGTYISFVSPIITETMSEIRGWIGVRTVVWMRYLRSMRVSLGHKQAGCCRC